MNHEQPLPTVHKHELSDAIASLTSETLPGVAPVERRADRVVLSDRALLRVALQHGPSGTYSPAMFDDLLAVVSDSECGAFGFAAQKNGFVEIGRTALRRAVRNGDLHAAHCLAALERSLGNLSAADDAFGEAIELGSNIAAASWGTMHSDAGDFERAEEIYRSCLPSVDGVVENNLALLLHGIGQGQLPEQAVALLKDALAKGCAPAATNLGQHYSDLGCDSKAMEIWRVGYGLGSKVSAVALVNGLLLRLAHEGFEASIVTEILEVAGVLNRQESTGGHGEIGKALAEAAETDIAQLLSLLRKEAEEGVVFAWEVLGRSLASVGDMEGAIDAYSAGVAAGSPYCAKKLSDLHYLLTPERRSSVLEVLTSSLNDPSLSDTGHGARLNALAMLHLRTGDSGRALELWSQGEELGDPACIGHLAIHAGIEARPPDALDI